MARGLASAADQLASYGRNGDNVLAHISRDEAAFLDKMQGGTSVNPSTGLPEYFSFKKLLKAVVRVGTTVGAFVASGGNPLAAAAASGAATKLTGGSWKQSALSAGLSGLTAGAGNYLSGGQFMSNAGLSAGASGATLPAAGEIAAANNTSLGQLVAGGGIGAAPAVDALGGQLIANAAPSGLGAALSSIGGTTGLGLGLGAVGNLNGGGGGGSGGDQAALPPEAKMNLNVAPLQRAYRPYEGDPNKYGEGPGHKFFDTVNPAPVYLARGGKRPSRAAVAGSISGPGGPTDDMVPAMLSHEEHVIDAATVKAAGKGNYNKGHKAVERFKQRVRRCAGMKHPSKPPAFGGA